VKQETLIKSKDNLSAAVTCLDTFDLYGDGKEELIVGRRDGTIQVFTTMLENNEFEMDCQQLLYEENFNESISCVFGGCIGVAGYMEIIACTYTGKVFGLTTRTLGDILTDTKSSNYDMVTDASQRIQKLK
jgi:Bardet-Biedl syndrome 7 protein